MTSLRDAAQAALEALDTLYERGKWGDFDGVADVLRAALAEPVEPVAWMFVDDTGMKFVSVDRTHKHCQPLYTAPPQRKPLSEDEVLDIARTFGAQPWPPGSCVEFARAVECAHGIGVNK